jgi:hypothetical protein
VARRIALTLSCLIGGHRRKERSLAVTDRPDQPRASTPAPSPFRLNLEQQRKRAKELLQGLRAGDAEALRRFRAHHPRADGLDDAAIAQCCAGLSEAQLVIARELGLPSWPRLKAHILAMHRARESIVHHANAPDAGITTLHIRCGTDIQRPLKQAGFAGNFLEYSDPLCQGPVAADGNWLARRAAFVAEAYGTRTGQKREEIAAKLDQAEMALRMAARHYERIVLWVEHDSYDQLVLARCLAQFAETPPHQLDLISVDRYPGGARFIGLGQLPPEALRLLWQDRQPVSERQMLAGQRVWNELRAADPAQLAAAASDGIPELPHLAKAVRRHCQELPWTRDGLSLTERLVLQILSDGPRTVGEVFRILMREREPLPWLGDVMLLHILDSMKQSREPVFIGAFEAAHQHWRDEWLSITATGRAVLAGDVDWLSLEPPERWLGGVCIPAAPPCWRWEEQTAMTVFR